MLLSLTLGWGSELLPLEGTEVAWQLARMFTLSEKGGTNNGE